MANKLVTPSEFVSLAKSVVEKDWEYEARTAQHHRDMFRDVIIEAYGILWRDPISSSMKHEARRALMAVLTKTDRGEGIKAAIERFGAPTKEEMLKYGP